MRKNFCIAGPVNQPNDYKIDPLSRWNLAEILDLIDQRKYFVMHAPRQTGKTSCLLALQDKLNDEGKYFAVYINIEPAQVNRHNYKDTLSGIAGILFSEVDTLADYHFKDDKEIFRQKLDYMASSKIINKMNPENRLADAIKYICGIVTRPVVLFVDEIDSLMGDSLVAVLRQLRSGYKQRPETFPSSIILCGIRDVRDYRIHTSGQEIIAGGSVFNIKTESLRLGNFSKDEVKELYNLHTSETGQVFEEEIYDYIMDLTDGQPWLVNALANQATWRMRENRDPAVRITKEIIQEAKEQLILKRETHIDQLSWKLLEERVNRVILPMIMGEEVKPAKDDVDYCIDLGILKDTPAGPVIVNEIYKEIIPRELSSAKQTGLEGVLKPDWVNADGSINAHTLLTMFKHYWFENSSIWSDDMVGYLEAAPHLVTQAFLQRVANGNGYVEREYALGRKRVDLMIKWKYASPMSSRVGGGRGGETHYQSIVIEIKTINKKQKYEKIKQLALEQTAEYAKKCGEKEAHILIFDRDRSQDWNLEDSNEIEECNGVKIEIWKMTTEE